MIRINHRKHKIICVKGEWEGEWEKEGDRKKDQSENIMVL